MARLGARSRARGLEMREDLAIAPGTRQATLGATQTSVAIPGRGLDDAGHCLLAQAVVAHNAPLSHLFASDLELGFHEQEPVSPWSDGHEPGDEQGQGNERHIGDDEIRDEGNLVGFEVAGVETFDDHDPRIEAETGMKLTVTHVEGHHPRGAGLE